MFTQGKWKIADKSLLFFDICNDSGDRTALIPVITINAEANAQLIAAAPDLYDALVDLIDLRENPGYDAARAEHVTDNARLAIAKVRGF